MKRTDVLLSGQNVVPATLIPLSADSVKPAALN